MVFFLAHQMYIQFVRLNRPGMDALHHIWSSASFKEFQGTWSPPFAYSSPTSVTRPGSWGRCQPYKQNGAVGAPAELKSPLPWNGWFLLLFVTFLRRKGHDDRDDLSNIRIYPTFSQRCNFSHSHLWFIYDLIRPDGIYHNWNFLISVNTWPRLE